MKYCRMNVTYWMMAKALVITFLKAHFGKEGKGGCYGPDGSWTERMSACYDMYLLKTNQVPLVEIAWRIYAPYSLQYQRDAFEQADYEIGLGM